MYNHGPRAKEESCEERFTVRRNGETFHKIFFLDPKGRADKTELAKELLGLDEVVEVYVDEGVRGFRAEARISGKMGPDEAARYFKENYGRQISNEYGRLVSCLDVKR